MWIFTISQQVAKWITNTWSFILFSLFMLGWIISVAVFTFSSYLILINIITCALMLIVVLMILKSHTEPESQTIINLASNDEEHG
ncbi:MAG: hypothetical protein AB7V32_10320 [Candidatus Berkiella sp.]